MGWLISYVCNSNLVSTVQVVFQNFEVETFLDKEYPARPLLDPPPLVRLCAPEFAAVWPVRYPLSASRARSGSSEQRRG